MANSSFERGLAVLAEVAAGGDVSVEEISTRLGIPLSSVYRYMKSLRSQGYIEEDGGIYRPGPTLLNLGGRYLVHNHLSVVGSAVLREIVDAVGETAVIIIRVGAKAMCLRRIESSRSMRYTFAVNELLPLHAGAGARILLAWAPANVIRQVLEGAPTRFTPNTPSVQQIVSTIPEVRQAGWILSRGELDPGAVSIAVPVFLDGEVVCSINVAGPEDRCDSPAWIQRTLPVLMNAAANLTDSLEALSAPLPERKTLHAS